MIFDFFIQLIFALVLFFGLAGIGFLILDIFRIRENIFLRSGLSFFISLAIFVLLAVLSLFIFPQKLEALFVFSALYFLASFAILFFSARRVENIKAKIYSGFKKYIPVWIGIFLTVVIFFLGLYKTALLDEQLHRPVVESFTQNGIFPLADPQNPNVNFTLSYHYGMEVVGSATKMITHLNAPEALDVAKVGYLLATFLLFCGLLLKWTKKTSISVLGTIFILFCGSSFFMFDGFSLSHIAVWGEWTYSFVYPLLYSLDGITWVNIPLSIAFLFIIESMYLKNVNYSLRSFFVMIAAIAGFFLISELFGILMAGWILALAIYNLWRKKISSKVFIFSSILFVAFVALAVFYTGGVLTNIFIAKTSLQQIVFLKPISQWGYFSERGLMQPWNFFETYLKNFLLVAVLVLLLGIALLKKKIYFKDHPVLFATATGAFIIPFVFSISMGDLNLYKLVHLAIVSTYLLFFYYFSFFWKWNKWLSAFVIMLFVLGSVPIVIVNYGVQWGNWARAKDMHCAYNDQCYDKNVAKMFEEFDQKSPGLKKFFTDSASAPMVVDLSNSYTYTGYSLSDSLDILKENKIQYIFYSPALENGLSPEIRKIIKKLPAEGKSGNYSILKVY